ncbi:MAG: 2-hydroxyacyl-CoA dehydratase family protein [Actinomycetota bacterium]|nr:2-hydroxyacyl-CoA dehydratase family protein [Actinomycetota bacterium]
MIDHDDRLASARDALRHQKAWFARLHEHAAAGGLVALVNADTPHEVLRAFDIPYVVNQWWSSIAASRGGAQRYLDLVAAKGLPRDSDTYSALGLGSALDPEPSTGPWGGLPRPFLVLGDLTGDVAGKVLDVWDAQDGVTFFPFENTARTVDDERWWKRIATAWEEVVGPERIDVMTAELHELIALLEARTGQAFDPDRFAEIMRLGNEQAAWNRRTRDLIAAVRPLPVRVGDTIPAVMVPQWHRGSVWGRDAARALYEEVAARVAAGRGVVAEERLRLMWIGRGLWFDLDFYRHFEREHGAVFVWSMYLAIAADGYARYGGDPLRALASRFVGFHEHLYVPPGAAEWYVAEARRHGVDGVVHLVSRDPRGSWATTAALRRAGIPTYELHAENADDSAYDVDAVRADVAAWLTDEVSTGRGVSGRP